MEFECAEGHKVFSTWGKLRDHLECPICKNKIELYSGKKLCEYFDIFKKKGDDIRNNDFIMKSYFPTFNEQTVASINLYYSNSLNPLYLDEEGVNHIGEFISPLTPKEKDPCLKLLSLIFYSPSNEDESFDTKIYYPYLSPVLSILQNLIKDTNSPIFPTISNIFAEIVQNIMPTDIEASNVDLDQEEKTAYEMLQGFCIYNMKYDDKSNRIVGSLCLTKLVENCPIVLQKQYMKLIWEVIISLIDKISNI